MKETEEEKQERLAKNAQYMAMPYEAKVCLARNRIWEWYDECRKNGKDYAVSVGGLDSITLLHLVRDELGEDTKGISVSVLEDKSIQEVHKQLGVVAIKPLKSKVQILQEYGFPVISKLNAAKIERLQTPGDTSPIIKAYMTGDTGPWGGFGIHLDKRPHHFDLLREQNPQEWEFWMYRCVTDESGTYGWGRVLDYLGIGWENDPYTDCVGQMEMRME